MKIRKWRVEHHPTVNPIPIAIVPGTASMGSDESVPLLKNTDFYDRVVALVDEHNKLVDKYANPRSDVEDQMTKVSVYLDDGRVFEYEVSNQGRGREHASAIIKTGYRSTPKGSTDLEWYPPHRIFKVKVEGGGGVTRYRDTVRAT